MTPIRNVATTRTVFWSKTDLLLQVSDLPVISTSSPAIHQVMRKWSSVFLISLTFTMTSFLRCSAARLQERPWETQMRAVVVSWHADHLNLVDFMKSQNQVWKPKISRMLLFSSKYFRETWLLNVLITQSADIDDSWNTVSKLHWLNKCMTLSFEF